MLSGLVNFNVVLLIAQASGMTVLSAAIPMCIPKEIDL